MNQIPLRLQKVISYQSDNFYWHLGLQRIKSFFEVEACSHDFSASYLYGVERSGKTHLAIVLSELFARHQFYPLLISAGEFLQLDYKTISTTANLIIIDDFQQILKLNTEESVDSVAKFIDFYEAIKSRSAKLVLLANQHFKNYKVSEHLGSRLANMQIFSLDGLQDKDLNIMIFHLAKQRGVFLNETNQDYLAKRLPRSIALIEAYLDRMEYFLKETGLPLNRANLAKAL